MNDLHERLCACLRDPAPRAESVPADVLAAARAEGVHLLLAGRLRLSSFADELRTAAVVEALRERELRIVLAEMANAGVRPILLKGAALAHTHYPRPELRPRADTDLMVPAASRDAVGRALTAIGYRQPPEPLGELTRGQFHFQKHDRLGLHHELDVHWRISNVRAFGEALRYEELARDAVPIPTLGPHARGPSPVHALLLACVHRVAHHADSDSLLWLFDIHLLARGCSAQERDAFVDLARARRMCAVCAKGLRLADAAFGDVDRGWIDRLAAAPGAEPTAAFLGGLRPVDVLKADLAAMPGWRWRVQLLREHVFPSPAFIYERYRMQQPLALPFLYLHRLLSGLPKWFRR